MWFFFNWGTSTTMWLNCAFCSVSVCLGIIVIRVQVTLGSEVQCMSAPSTSWWLSHFEPHGHFWHTKGSRCSLSVRPQVSQDPLATELRAELVEKCVGVRVLLRLLALEDHHERYPGVDLGDEVGTLSFLQQASVLSTSLLSKFICYSKIVNY